MATSSKYNPEFSVIAARMLQLGMSAHETAFALGVAPPLVGAWATLS